MKYALLASLGLSLLGACNLDNGGFGSDGGMSKVVGTDSSHVYAIGTGTADDTLFQLDGGGASKVQQFAGESLYAIAANAPSDLWVVGTAVHHYDGQTWTTIPMPADPLVAIGNGWAIGEHGTVYQPGAGFGVLGAADARIDLTGPGVIEANAWGDASNNIWVTDGTRLFHYTTSWTDLTPPSAVAPTQLQALTGTGAKDVWVSTFDGRQFHYDGAAWSTMTDSANNDLVIGMFEHAPNDVWAVGYSNVLMHYNGTAWTSQAAPPQLHCDGPDVNGDATVVACTNNVALNDVWGSSANDVWVVGYLELDPGGLPILFHFDGTAWTDLSPE
jgi:hypothetical protein